MKFDELNIFKTFDVSDKSDGLEDSLLDLLIMEYVYGVNEANLSLSASLDPSYSEMEKAIYHKIDGKDFRDRLKEAKDSSEILRIVETESHRVKEAGMYDTAIASGIKCHKVWRTVEDNKVRDTHDYLNGVSKPLNEDFYTYTGKHAPYPSAFNDAAEDCNCRCYLEIEKDF